MNKCNLKKSLLLRPIAALCGVWISNWSLAGCVSDGARSNEQSNSDESVDTPEDANLTADLAAEIGSSYVLNGADSAVTHTVKFSSPIGQACSGVMIHPKVMLTAKHCFRRLPGAQNEGKMFPEGESFSGTMRTNVAANSLINFTGNAYYDPTNVPNSPNTAITCADDFAVVKITAIDVAFPGSTVKVDTGTIPLPSTVSAYGWGKVSLAPEVGTSKLRKWDFALTAVQSTILVANVSGGINGHGVCIGDSGGPAAVTRTISGVSYQAVRGIESQASKLVSGCSTSDDNIDVAGIQQPIVCWARVSENQRTDVLVDKAGLICTEVVPNAKVWTCRP